MRLLPTLALLFVLHIVYSQDLEYVEIQANEFSSYNAFSKSPPPHITGRGIKSDSLSQSNLVFDYYVSGEEYYPIESWADYYYWMSKEFAYLFNKPEIFEHFYKLKDDVQMIKYLSINFSVWHFPSTIKIKPHVELNDYQNRFSITNHIVKSESDKKYMLNQMATKRNLLGEN
ncbi:MULTISPECIES: hypothetical protein [Flammeovirga]|uniref:Uncharacterized protein n=1 Tax=Flammeovirga agarivorans TaxID=2726742 RepID=A0A7X8SGY0_9BACT|nr:MULTISPECIES: hypothetical protein [Flammeovirga]NLR89932.1 hypothetical protein [Flammeovirga agarivorans]